MDHSSLDFLSPADRALFLEFGIGPRSSPTLFGCIHHAFMHHAAQNPSAIAVEHGTDAITYAALDLQSNQLARRLRAVNVGPGSRVCVLAQRGIALIVGILGVIKAGGQYIPLDGGIVTDSTLSFVLDDSHSTVALTLRRFASRLPSSLTRFVLEDVIQEDIASAADGSPVEDVSLPSHGYEADRWFHVCSAVTSNSFNRLYIIYTSGESRSGTRSHFSHPAVLSV